MYAVYALCNLLDIVHARQHLCRCVYHRIFDKLFLHSAHIAFSALATFGKANIVVMNSTRMRSSAFTAHSMLAISAYEFARKDIVENLFFTARRKFVFFVYCVYLVPKFVGYNSRKDIVV